MWVHTVIQNLKKGHIRNPHTSQSIDEFLLIWALLMMTYGHLSICDKQLFRNMNHSDA